MEYEKEAWRGEPAPDGADKLQYYMLREVYHLNRTGEIPQEIAKQLKDVLAGDATYNDRASLLRYCIASLFSRMADDVQLQRDTWVLVEGYMALTTTRDM